MFPAVMFRFQCASTADRMRRQERVVGVAQDRSDAIGDYPVHQENRRTRQMNMREMRRSRKVTGGRGVRYERADGIRAMPSARALLVASLLTEPPYGCLGPSGNDRYRKRSLRSQTVGLRKPSAKSRRLFRNESATSRRVRAGAIGGSTAMTRTAFCRKSPRVPRVCWLGSRALGTSDRGRGARRARRARRALQIRLRESGARG
jgi:hypothetical protein